MSDDAEPAADLEAWLEAVDDVTRVRAALRVLDSMPVDELRLYMGALHTASTCTDFDSDDLAVVLSLWRSLDNRQGTARFLKNVVARSVRQARTLTAEQGLVGDALVSVLHAATDEALRDARTLHQREERRRRRHGEDDGRAVTAHVPVVPKVVDDLRAWTAALQGAPAAVGVLAELRRTLPKLGVWNPIELTVFIELLAQVPDGATRLLALDGGGDDGDGDGDRGVDNKAARAIADDVGQVVEDELSWPHILLFTRHVHRLGLTGAPRQRVLAQLLAVCMRAGDVEGIALVVGLVGDSVDNAILAYNMACLSAQTGDRAGVLRHTARALELGKRAMQFEDDPDFDGWRDDVEFAALLKAPPTRAN